MHKWNTAKQMLMNYPEKILYFVYQNKLWYDLSGKFVTFEGKWTNEKKEFHGADI